MTRDEAVELIERMKTTRPTCDKCETMSYDWAAGAFSCAHGWIQWVKTEDVNRWMLEQHNFDECANRAGYLRRCATCKDSLLFPWANKLTPEAVVEFVEKEPWRDDTSWPLDDLRAVADAMTAPGGFEFL